MFSHYNDFHNTSYVQTFSKWALGDFQSFLHFLKYNSIYKLLSKKLIRDKFAKYSHILKWWYLDQFKVINLFYCPVKTLNTRHHICEKKNQKEI